MHLRLAHAIAIAAALHAPYGSRTLKKGPGRLHIATYDDVASAGDDVPYDGAPAAASEVPSGLFGGASTESYLTLNVPWPEDSATAPDDIRQRVREDDDDDDTVEIFGDEYLDDDGLSSFGTDLEMLGGRAEITFRRRPHSPRRGEPSRASRFL